MVHSPDSMRGRSSLSGGASGWRRSKDRIARWTVTAGGMGVIVAISAIFFYLLWVVWPMFLPAQMDAVGDYPLPGPSADTVFMSSDELGQVAVRYTDTGQVVFFDLDDGAVRDQRSLVPDGAAISVVDVVSEADGLVAIGLDDGRALLVRHRFAVSYPDGERTITPEIEYPLGREPILVDDEGSALQRVTGRSSQSGAMLVAYTADGRIGVANFRVRQNFLTGTRTVERAASSELRPPGVVGAIRALLLGPDMDWLYLIQSDGDLQFYQLGSESAPELVQRSQVTADGEGVTQATFLLGGSSLLVGTDAGRILQFFPVRDARNRYALEEIRRFELEPGTAIVDIAPEHRRKGFMALDAAGRIGIFYTTSDQTLLMRHLGEVGAKRAGISPRADLAMIVDSDDRLTRLRIENEHPEVSWSAFWSEVWYEGYPGPDHVWQSSAATNEFEPKFSLVPLSVGTLKAAFYAMLVAVPLALMGAMYTAYFMSARMRRLVKPTIEVMEALPTVILGFLAGLWLAPYLEDHLFSVFALILALPLATVGFGMLWRLAPTALQDRVPDGWQAALLIPALVATGALVLAVGDPVEQYLFPAGMPQWLTNELGIPFDQRNSLVVGLAMGFAVIPTIFSIAEDSLFSVPKHLTYGSLAMGATPWQTLVRVVLPTASPGMFSAVMIGMGRAVGETMIVLMATGNTPITNFNIFEGMRTLSANIAVEMPESEVGSTHFRVLFLAALVLFLFTFVVNTGAELVRQRLRRKYASL